MFLAKFILYFNTGYFTDEASYVITSKGSSLKVIILPAAADNFCLEASAFQGLSSVYFDAAFAGSSNAFAISTG